MNSYTHVDAEWLRSRLTELRQYGNLSAEHGVPFPPDWAAEYEAILAELTRRWVQGE